MTPTGEWTSVWKKNMHQPWVGFTLPFLICEIGYGVLRARTTAPGHNNPLEHTLSLFQLFKKAKFRLIISPQDVYDSYLSSYSAQLTFCHQSGGFSLATS